MMSEGDPGPVQSLRQHSGQSGPMASRQVCRCTHLAQWLTTKPAQKDAIASYRIAGEQLFFPLETTAAATR